MTIANRIVYITNGAKHAIIVSFFLTYTLGTPQ